MTIDSLKSLQGLIRLCRKLGVRTMKVDGIEFTLDAATTSHKPRGQAQYDTEAFPEANIKVPTYTPVNTQDASPDKVETDELTEEQLMFYSARPEAATEQAEQ